MVTRTLATLVVRDNQTNADETILIFIPFPPNNQTRLDEYVNSFCSQKNVTLWRADFTGWVERIIRGGGRLPPGEYDCQVCNQACLKQSINPQDSLEINENFCSNFCRAIASQESNNNDNS